MTIKSFLDDVRFKTYTNNVNIPFDRSDENFSAVISELVRAINSVESLKESTEFFIENYYSVQEDVENVFKKIHNKIDKLEELAEGYQYLNTNELDNDVIYDLKVFNLSDKEGYNEITNSLTIPRLKKARDIRPSTIEKNHMYAEEFFKFQQTYRDSLIGIIAVDKSNTEIIRADILDSDKNLIETLLPVNFKILAKLSPEAKYIKVFSNNVEIDKGNYTVISVLENRYENFHSLIVGEGEFEKKGNLFKLSIEQNIPTESYLTFEMRVSFTNKYTNQLEEYTSYFNAITSRYILVDKNNVTGNVIDSGGNEVDVQNTLDDFVLVKEYSTHNSPVKYLGNKVFDISKIKADKFSISLKANMHNTIDNTKSPELKGIFAYVTER